MKKNIFNLTLGNRNSKSSVKSNERHTFNNQQTAEYHAQTNSSYPSISNDSNNTTNASNTNEVKAEAKITAAAQNEPKPGTEIKDEEPPMPDRRSLMK